MFLTPPIARSAALDIVLSGGVTGNGILLTLLLMSVAACALAVDLWLALRRIAAATDELRRQLPPLVAAGQWPAAVEACRRRPSPLAAVGSAGFAEAPDGWDAVEKAMEAELAEQSARLLRRIDYLSVVGNLAPMLGLLGTVFGMIFAFREVADSQGAARAADLASGIYQALVTTVGGLLVAIPSFAAYAVFRHRIDRTTSELAAAATELLRAMKRGTKPQGAAVAAQGGVR